MKRLSEIRLREDFKVIHYIPLESTIPGGPDCPDIDKVLVQACNRLPFQFKSSDLEALLHWENDGVVATYEETLDAPEKGRISDDFTAVNFNSKRHRYICEEVRKAWKERLRQFVMTVRAIETMAQSGEIKLTAPGQNG